MKYIVVTGGVLSGIGKGLIASSIGLLLRAHGLRVSCIKIDPYLNIDAGTLSPLDHGEVFVLDDGGEVDLDLGNYERFLDVTLTRENNITTGKIYSAVIDQERRGDFLGKTVQVVPHVTDAIQNWIRRVSEIPLDDSGRPSDVCIVELGGTIGDIESAPFIEALRQFQFKVGQNSFCLVLVSLVPVVGSVGEQKTKPTQSCVRDLRALGLSPDIVACRSSLDLNDAVVAKIVDFCHVSPKSVFPVKDCSSVYEVPILLHRHGLLEVISDKLQLSSLILKDIPQALRDWDDLSQRFKNLRGELKVTIVGKYTHLKDSYISLIKAIEHASLQCGEKVDVSWIEATDLEPQTEKNNKEKSEGSWRRLFESRAIIIPGGFGERGIDGMVAAARWARENKIPLIGLCLGMQNLVVVFMPEGSKSVKGATMKLGSCSVKFPESSKDSKMYKLYKKAEIFERFRHRYVVDPKLNSRFIKDGLRVLSFDEKRGYANMVELDDHPFYVGTQYHPEYITRPLRPSPCFVGLIHAARGTLDEYLSS